MIPIVVLFGAAIAVLGLVGLVYPRALVHFIESFWQSPRGIYLAIGIRIILGLVLIMSAWEARYPLAFQVLGVITLVAAAAGAVLGVSRLQKFIAWWLAKPLSFVRAWAFIAIGLGLFLIFNIL